MQDIFWPVGWKKQAVVTTEFSRVTLSRVLRFPFGSMKPFALCRSSWQGMGRRKIHAYTERRNTL
jgi:hypothetical protein